MTELTPADLARELSRSPKTIRAYLREVYGTVAPERWKLSDEQVADVRRRFSQARRD